MEMEAGWESTEDEQTGATGKEDEDRDTMNNKEAGRNKKGETRDAVNTSEREEEDKGKTGGDEEVERRGKRV